MQVSNTSATAQVAPRAIVWSPQQNAFINWAETGTGSCVLEAVAGAGKTTTLLQAARKMKGWIAILAYNKDIAEEIKGKTRDDRNIEAGTVHSFGFKAYRKAYPKVRVDANKVRHIVDAIVPDEKDFTRPAICKLVAMAKQRALGVIGSLDDESAWYEIAEHFDIFENGKNENPLPEAYVVQMAREAMTHSIGQTHIIDFDDMVFMPIYLKLRFFRFDAVFVDEAQDTNPARRALVRAIVKQGGRVIAVGDRHQAIYGFTGADNDSLELIAKDFNCVQMPLTVTYRCPKAIVAFAQQWVGHITAAETAPEGAVTSIGYKEFSELGAEALAGDRSVLCRVTKPLVALAFALIRRRVPCKVLGRDIGANIKKLIERWTTVKTLDALEKKLDKYLEAETTKLLAKQKESQAAALEDMVGTVRVIIDQCRAEGKNKTADAVAYVDQLFSDDVKGVLTLSTIHKAKGREWKTVYWLDRLGTCPSRWARQQWQKDQEVNLMYVAATRSKDTLVEIIGQPPEEKKAA